VVPRSNLERTPGGGVSLTLGNDVIPVAEAVPLCPSCSLASSSHRNYGWINTSLLSVPVCQCQVFFQLRQLRRVRSSLNNASVATLVHAFVTSRIDYCNCLLAGATKSLMDKLQRVINAAVRVVCDTHKFDRGLTNIGYTS